MKKVSLILPALLLLGPTSFAGELPRCNPSPWIMSSNSSSPQETPLRSPDDVRKFLEEIRQRHEDSKVSQILGESTLRSLEQYSKLDKHQIYANAYVAAAAAGAAAAVVDYVWDKYVGNGGKDKWVIDEGQFDLPQVPRYPNVPKDFKAAGGVMPPLRRNVDPVALTPAVATAVAGAAAYKAAEYSLRKAFGDPNSRMPNLKVRPEMFDLQNNQFQRRGY
ncbi:hypothetical protein AZI86_08715 [Bdellovibrio bacteriovorus]|uniref:Uncharacterized protein n=1 Tax=Bdellovibrio bacteriovorus TaxID=959 RepID=A0A150WRE4_BDEBC|nr:hypothetical protein [Bdellovibrio bacteriovorus]KYG67083.1 hypothetical protein AZI86_08715 [Bdellovibrio bacteriovorus]